MKIYMVSNPYKFDVEQTAIILMPERSPRVSGDPAPRANIAEDYGVSTLTVSKKSVRAEFFLQLSGKSCTETAQSIFTGDESAGERESETRHTLRRSVYKAYSNLTGEKPAWGALAGVRPAKLGRLFLERGMTAAEAQKHLQNRYYLSPEKAGLTMKAALCSHELAQKIGPKDAALYIGIPFCPSRCAYCSFISSAATGKAAEKLPAYLAALSAELELSGAALSAAGVSLRAVYVGGGTPGILSPEQLRALTEQVRRDFLLAPDCEFTVELGRPDTVTAEKLAALLEGGVGRISVNPQSFSDRVLSGIGRGHGVAEVYSAFELARDAGDFEINMDLIAGLPGDSLAGFSNSVRMACDMAPENITVHTLAVKKGSAFARDAKLSEPSVLAGMLSAGAGLLSANGYEPYYLYRQKYSGGSFENTGYARDGKICRYNCYMMDELLPVVGAGSGAVTKLFCPGGKILRINNAKYPAEYMQDPGAYEKKAAAIADFYAGDGKV